MKRFCLLIYFLFAACWQHLCAQQKEFLFKNFTQEEGLPSNEAYYIFEDSRHYIWIATDLGVVRYNGNKFEQFNLPDNVVFKIKEDSKGRIWFFSHKAQLTYFENEKIKVFRYNENILNRIQKIHIIDALIDSNDNVFLNSALDSNYIIHPNGEIESYLHDFYTYIHTNINIDYKANSSCFTTITSKSAYISDTIIIKLNSPRNHLSYTIPVISNPFTHYGCISKDGLDYYLYTGKFLFKLCKDGTYKIKKMPGEILCMSFYKENIWVGMAKNGGVLLSKELLEKNEYSTLLNKSITSVLTDYEGGIWFSTLEKGIYYTKNSNIWRIEEKENADTYTSRVFNVEDSFFIYSRTNGLYKYEDAKSDFFLPFKNIIATDLFVEDGLIYLFGASDKYSEFRQLNDLKFKHLYYILTPAEPARLNRDTFFLSSSTSVYLILSDISRKLLSTLFLPTYNATKEVLSKPARMFLDADKNVWAGANDGLYKLNQAHDTMLKFMASSALLNKGISCIRQMNNGILSLGIRQNGIALLKDSSIIAHITEAEGLLSNKIRFVLPVNDQLWIATAKGISVIRFSSYTPLQYTITNIGKDDGFYNVTINQLTAYKKNIVAATSNGIYFIEDSQDFLTRKLPAIPFHINTISSFRGDTSGISSIVLPYSKNRLVIKYSAVSFNSYETVKYLYRFDHTDTIWHSTTSSELLLENLEAGTYDLQIKAVISNQQRQSPIVSFSITVEKPWWQNNWLRLLLVLLIAGVTYLYVKNRIKKIRLEETKKTEINAKLAELEQTALRSQMNPHFIFNCLTSIQQLIVSGNKTDANEYLVKFARLIRKTLELSMHPFISIREEIEYLNEYLFLEQLRLSGHFEYRINTDKMADIDKTYIPNMMIQPVVENCIRHGIKSLENRKGKIEIMFVKNETAITCTVTDNGIGRTDKSSYTENAFSKHKSYGMEIIRKRLQAYAEFNDQYSGIEIKDLYEENGVSCGTQVTLQLPYKKNI